MTNYKDQNRKRSDEIRNETEFVEIDESMMTEEEKAEAKEFKNKTKKYNQISKTLRIDAIVKEKSELATIDKSPKNKYYEGSKQDRIRALDEELQVLIKMEKQLNHNPS